jgi:hypothetical protein
MRTCLNKVFLFIAYVLLCLLINRDFHPFYRFDMYNRFANLKRVFTLKNADGKVIPFDKYYSLSENGVLILFENEMKSGAPDSVIGDNVWLAMQKFKKLPLQGENNCLTVTNYQVKNAQIIADEQSLYCP